MIDIDSLSIIAGQNFAARQSGTLVARYLIDEGTLVSAATVIDDKSSNDFDGNITGATWAVRSTGRVIAKDFTEPVRKQSVVSRQPLWLFTAATPHNMTIRRTVKESGDLVAWPT